MLPLILLVAVLVALIVSYNLQPNVEEQNAHHIIKDPGSFEKRAA